MASQGQQTDQTSQGENSGQEQQKEKCPCCQREFSDHASMMDHVRSRCDPEGNGISDLGLPK